MGVVYEAVNEESAVASRSSPAQRIMHNSDMASVSMKRVRRTIDHPAWFGSQKFGVLMARPIW